MKVDGRDMEGIWNQHLRYPRFQNILPCHQITNMQGTEPPRITGEPLKLNLKFIDSEAKRTHQRTSSGDHSQNTAATASKASKKWDSVHVHTFKYKEQTNEGVFEERHGELLDILSHWKGKYLSLSQDHQKIVSQLTHQLEEKETALAELGERLKEAESLASTLTDGSKEEGGKGWFQKQKQNPCEEGTLDGQEQLQDEEKGEIRERTDLQQEVNELNERIAELEIYKRWSDLKEEQWASEHFRLTKELECRQFRLDVAKTDKITTTSELMASSSSSFGVIRSKLLGLLECNVRLTKLLREDPIHLQKKSAAAHVTSLMTPKRRNLSLEEYFSVVLKSPLNSSDINCKVRSPMSQNDFEDFDKNNVTSITENRTSSNILPCLKAAPQLTPARAKWMQLKSCLEELKQDNLCLRNYITSRK